METQVRHRRVPEERLRVYAVVKYLRHVPEWGVIFFLIMAAVNSLRDLCPIRRLRLALVLPIERRKFGHIAFRNLGQYKLHFCLLAEA